MKKTMLLLSLFAFTVAAHAMTKAPEPTTVTAPAVDTAKKTSKVKSKCADPKSAECLKIKNKKFENQPKK